MYFFLFFFFEKLAETQTVLKFISSGTQLVYVSNDPLSKVFFFSTLFACGRHVKSVSAQQQLHLYESGKQNGDADVQVVQRKLRHFRVELLGVDRPNRAQSDCRVDAISRLVFYDEI